MQSLALVDLGVGPYVHERCSTRFPVYTRGNAGEVWPEVAYPLSISLTRAFDDPMNAAMVKTGLVTNAELAEGTWRGPLHGIPYGAKDLLAVAGYPPTWGAKPYANQIIDRDAAVIRKLDDAGAILVAKLTLGALAWGDVWFGGKTRNPWDLEQGSSGSSAGPASATAAGLVPFAIGSETWGSIVSPATRCGVTGLRPTFGRVSRDGAMALSWSMDKIGPLCRTVEDCAIVLSAVCGSDPADPAAVDAPFNYRADLDLRTLRVGYLKAMFDRPYPGRNADLAASRAVRARAHLACVHTAALGAPSAAPLRRQTQRCRCRSGL